jgi:hypothetical protein
MENFQPGPENATTAPDRYPNRPKTPKLSVYGLLLLSMLSSALSISACNTVEANANRTTDLEAADAQPIDVKSLPRIQAELILKEVVFL